MNRKLKISIIAVAVVLTIVAAIVVLFKIKNKSMPKNYTENDAKQALERIKREHGVDMAKTIERLYRWETAHFKSKQYKLTGSPGMEVHGSAPYYGWNSSFWQTNKSLQPIGTTEMFENKGMSEQGGNAQVTDKPKGFLIFPSVFAAMAYLVDYINRYNGNYARWYSTSASAQELYRTKLNSVTPKIVNSLA